MVLYNIIIEKNMRWSITWIKKPNKENEFSNDLKKRKKSHIFTLILIIYNEKING